MRRVFFITLFVFLLSSCALLERIPQKEYIHDTTTVFQNNNIYVHDSIYVWRDHTIYEKGDTVYDKVVEYKDRWRIKEVHDTLYKDRIKYEYKEVPVEVEKPLTGIQKMLIVLGKIFCILGLIMLGYLGFKLYGRIKFRKRLV